MRHMVAYGAGFVKGKFAFYANFFPHMLRICEKVDILGENLQEVSGMSMGDRIRRRRQELGMSVEAVARALGKNRATVYRYERGDIEQLPMGVLEPLSQVLCTTPAYLAGWSEETEAGEGLLRVRRRRVPLVGAIACGEPICAPESDALEVDVLDVREDLSCDCAMVCRGDSMTGARIYDGDIVYLRRQDDVEDGQIAAVSIDGELTLKRVFKVRDLDEEGRVIYRTELRAENPRYAPIRLGGPGETRRADILGLAVAFRSRIV